MSEQNPEQPKIKKESEEKVTSENTGSRRNFIKYGAAFAVGVVATSAVELPVLESQISQQNTSIQQKDSQIQSLNTQVQQQTTQIGQLTSQVNTDKQTISGLQGQIAQETGFLILNPTEQSLVEAIAETVIPSDSNGPGAKEAGVIYFIDHQLATEYGLNSNMFMQGPFVQSGQKGPITVKGITYPNGTPSTRQNAGTTYQYSFNLRYFWREGLKAIQDYANSAYGGDFEKLSASQQTQVLQDLWADKPTNFVEIIPHDIAYELFNMIWTGFFADPLYGGNIGMVGWTYTGFCGANMGNFYNEGYSDQQLMVSDKPIRLKPASLAQYQASISTSGG